jgi:hypothetical protein
MRRWYFLAVSPFFQAPALREGGLVFILHRGAEGAWLSPPALRLAP